MSLNSPKKYIANAKLWVNKFSQAVRTSDNDLAQELLSGWIVCSRCRQEFMAGDVMKLIDGNISLNCPKCVK